MEHIVGIVAEYNPFHNGHLYHLQKVKEMFPDSPIVLVLGGNFTQRGEVSLLDKWTKTKIALNYGIDLVVELPFPLQLPLPIFLPKELWSFCIIWV